MGGKSWRATPLSMAAWGEYIEFLKQAFLRIQIKGAEQITDPELREKVITRAFDIAAELGFESPQLRSTWNSVAGHHKLIYMLLKPKHPEITEEIIAEALEDEGQRILVMEEIADLIAPRSTSKKKAVRPKHKSKKRRKPSRQKSKNKAT